MLDGMYVVTFKSPLGEGSGVIVLRQGKIQGGDSIMYYDGSYQESGAGGFRGTLRTGQHTKVVGMASVLGDTSASLEFDAYVENGAGTVTGKSPQSPGLTLNATLKKIAD